MCACTTSVTVVCTPATYSPANQEIQTKRADNQNAALTEAGWLLHRHAVLITVAGTRAKPSCVMTKGEHIKDEGNQTRTLYNTRYKLILNHFIASLLLALNLCKQNCPLNSPYLLFMT